jgi:hypothetical protein
MFGRRRFTRISRVVGLAAGLTLLAFQPRAAVAAQPPDPEVGLSIQAQTSTPGSVSPDVNGNVATYEYTIFDGQSVTDDIPIQFCITGQNDVAWTSFDMHFAGPNGGLPGVTVPANVHFASPVSDGTCKSGTIHIATGALNLSNPQVSQQFPANVQISVDNPNPAGPHPKLTINDTGPHEIHIRVLVQPAAAQSNISCFITDSGGNFLTNCNGEAVTDSGSDAGRFAIVANKKNIEVATNPGQFYDNVLYYNSGSTPITVNVHFDRLGVDPHGTQAIHAWIFPPPFAGITPANFDQVNDGLPDGADDEIDGLEIPAGWTLWVDYHLDWNGLGVAVPPGCATNCATANQHFSVQATVTVQETQAVETCTAGAWGYKK